MIVQVQPYDTLLSKDEGHFLEIECYSTEEETDSSDDSSSDDDDALIERRFHDYAANLQKKKKKKKLNHHEKQQQSIKKPKKCVSFHKDVVVISCLHKNDYTTLEKQLSWYNQNEYIQIREDNRPIITWMKNKHKNSNDSSTSKNNPSTDNTDNNELFCQRGLEHWVYERAIEKKNHRDQARSIVLEEQKRQRMIQGNNINKNSDLAIAARYSSICKYSAFSAYGMGILDSQILQELEKEEQEEKNVVVVVSDDDDDSVVDYEGIIGDIISMTSCDDDYGSCIIKEEKTKKSSSIFSRMLYGQ